MITAVLSGCPAHCEQYKLGGRGCGLPPRNIQVQMESWSTVAVDLIGPWAITIDDQE